MAYDRTTWIDHIVDPSNGNVLQQGTAVTAARLNNIEKGILDMHIKSSDTDTLLDRAIYDINRISFELAIRNMLAEGTMQNIIVDRIEASSDVQSLIGIYDATNKKVYI